MSPRSFRIGRSLTGLGLFATKPIGRGVYIATYRGRRISTEEGSRPARGTRRKIYVRTQQPMDDRWLAAMECGALHQPFLPTECEAGGAEGRYRDRRIAQYRIGGRNHLRLRTRIFGLFPQEQGLPLRSMPQKGRPSPAKSAAAPCHDQMSWRMSAWGPQRRLVRRSDMAGVG